jgi:thiol-disulfide isomerase/thioredoxin
MTGSFDRSRVRQPRGFAAPHPRKMALACLSLLMAAVSSHADTNFDLESLRGRVIYLDFWASWCTPCRQSFPWMQAMKDAYAADGLTLVAVNLDHDRADAQRFLQQFNPDFEVRFDPQGTLAEEFKVIGMPTSVLLDRHGVVRFTHVGFKSAERGLYETQLRELLAEK